MVKKKIFYFFFVVLIQWGLFFLLSQLYFYFCKINRPDLSFGISYFYYTVAIYPLVLILWNTIILITQSKLLKIITCAILGVLTCGYWFYSLQNYPYRVSFLLVISIGLLIVGTWFLSKIMKNHDM
jgi:hypothetical protein